MLLNDEEIIQLCTPPKFMVTTYGKYAHDLPISDVFEKVFIPPPLVESPTYLSEDKILQAIKNKKQYDYTGIVSYRPFTEEECLNFQPMIENFVEGQIRETPTTLRTGINGTITYNAKVISFGVSSMGYDVRLAEDFKIFSNVNSLEVDPKNFDEGCLIDGKLNTASDGSKYVVIPPNSYLLGRTIEKFNVPRNMLILAIGKSTYARAGAIVNVTPIEPGFIGTVVIEVSNSTPLPLRVYANEGIAQFIFLEGEDCAVSYADRNGKYQNQSGVQLPLA